MSLQIKKGDKVEVLCGKDKGKVGKVLKVFPARERLIVEGVNLFKKHLRRRSESEAGGIKEIPLSLHISNVALFCPRCNRGVRFGVNVLEDKTKLRYCKHCKQSI